MRELLHQHTLFYLVPAPSSVVAFQLVVPLFIAVFCQSWLLLVRLAWGERSLGVDVGARAHAREVSNHSCGTGGGELGMEGLACHYCVELEGNGWILFCGAHGV